MQEALTAVIAVAATLSGSLMNHVLQQRASVRAAKVAEDDWLRKEQLSACTSFAETLADFRRAQYDRWHSQNRSQAIREPAEAQDLSYQHRAQAWQGYYRVKLVCAEPEFVELAGAAVTATIRIIGADDEAGYKERRVQAVEALDRFVEAAGRMIRTPGA
ncbi:hypothetical protein ACIBKX_08135 [Streptomyces sp. NPDC050658]|uniref:hypothetical protein n=1 Tax=unclassified Streptomyces TaxID=2593676 RepID=UPI0034482988